MAKQWDSPDRSKGTPEPAPVRDGLGPLDRILLGAFRALLWFVIQVAKAIFRGTFSHK